MRQRFLVFVVTRHEAWRRTSSTVPSCYPDQDPTGHRETAPRARPAPSLQPYTQEHTTRPSLGKSPSVESWGFQPPIGARQGVCQERTATRPSLGSGPFPRDRSSSRSWPVAWKNARPSTFSAQAPSLPKWESSTAEIWVLQLWKKCPRGILDHVGCPHTSDFTLARRAFCFLWCVSAGMRFSL